MKPKTEILNQADLFRSRLDSILNRRHPLFTLSDAINWEVFEKEFGEFFVPDFGRPGLSIRLVVGLHYLKHLYGTSDEGVVEMFLENPYWQYFCGCEFFVHEFPCNPTSLVKWRKRVGAQGMEKLLKETLDCAKRTGQLKDRDFEKVNVDTTVQEKAIAFPTDSRLYHKMRRRLVEEAKKMGIKLRQSYDRVSKTLLRKQWQYSHASQFRRARKQTKKLKTILGRVIRDIERKCSHPHEKMSSLLLTAHRLFNQKKEDKNKLYSIHAPEVECISKGKIHKKYEFGCKAAIVTTSKKCWVIGIDALHQNPFDGHTLKSSIDQMEKLTDQRPDQIFVDKGYRGEKNWPQDAQVFFSSRKLKPSLKKWLKRRAAIEPVIGHLKSDHRMNRNYLLGRDGDKMNVLLAASGFNMRKLIRAFFLFIFGWVILYNSNEQNKNTLPLLTVYA